MKSSRRQILTNPGFQLRFAILMTLTVLVLSMIFPIFVLQIFSTAETHPFLVNNPSALNALRDARKEFIITLICFQSLLVVASFLLSLLMSHRIAGPLYKLRMAMTAHGQGMLDRHITFRKKDNFKELASEFNAMSDSIMSRRRKDFEYIYSIIPKLERLKNSLEGEQQVSATEILNVLQELVRESHPSK